MNKPRQFAAIGEAMIEFRHQDERTLKMGFAGDTINIATYLARLTSHTGVQVNYVTALGDDPYSDTMLADWTQEGIQTQLVYRLSNKLPGVYLIRTEANGERHFYFYRSESAARNLFKGDYVEDLAAALVKMDFLYFSSITLAILDNASRERLFAILAQAKTNGATIVFDTNYRASLWPMVDAIKKLITQIAPYIDIILPTFGDEQAMFQDVSMEACAVRLHGFGIPEVVIKNGAEPCLISIAGKQEWVAAEAAKQVVDTTSAGDSFNAGYLAGRMQGLPAVAAAHIGHRLACMVISYPGAIIPREAMVDLI